MNRNEIYIKSGTQYKEMTKELLQQCGLASLIPDSEMQIGIKPNLVSQGYRGSGTRKTKDTKSRKGTGKEI
ncbi:hypothetical protein [Blautia sp.]